MKKLMLFAVLLVFYQNNYGQCDKTIVFRSDKGRGLKNGSVDKEMPLYATITIDSAKIVLTATINDESETLVSEIKEIAICQWSGFLKNGKTQYKVLTHKGDENVDNSIIEIVSDNGYTTITFSSDPDITGSKLQFDVSAYQMADNGNTGTGGKPAKKTKRQIRKEKKLQIGVAVDQPKGK